MDIDEIDQLISEFKHHTPKENIYLNPIDFGILSDRCFKQLEKPPPYMSLIGVYIYQDPEIDQGTYFICHPRMFEIWKSLKGNCWLQTAEDRITSARILYEAEQQQKERVIDQNPFN